MSIAAMNWAWLLRMAPTLKLLLMALADIADDSGLCWPSVAHLAKKCCVSERTVQRLLAALQRMEVLESEARFRADGSRTSNLYRLRMHAGDKLTPPLVSDVPDPLPGTSGEGDGGGTLTTIDPPLNLQQPQQHSGGSVELVFPKQLSEQEIEVAKGHLAGLEGAESQAILDELAGRLNSNSVRGAPLSYFRTLINRARDGTFTPEVGIKVASNRQREQELAARKRQDVSSDKTQSAENPHKHIAALRQVLTNKKKPDKE